MRFRSLCVGLCAATLLVSCSSDANGSDLGLGTTATTARAPTTTDAPETTVARTTIAPTTSTTTRSTTSTTEPLPTATSAAPSTEAPTTALPPVSEAPTTTGELSLEDKVKADFEGAVEARHHCSYDPYSCDYAAISVAGSPMDVETHQVVETRIEQNLRAVEGHGDVKTRIESVGFEGASAFVQICAYDTVVIFDVADPTNPGDDIIYDEEKVSFKVRWELREVEGRWLLFEGTNLEELKDGDLCGF
jgi:hypothetical protein